jgi:hypothetical protein
MITAHAETADGVGEHVHAVPAQHRAFELRLLLPCQLHGCEHSSRPHDESDHSCHIASFDYGTLSKTEVDVGPVVQPWTLMATACHPSSPLNFGTKCLATAHLAGADGARALPLRANLQVFLI